MPNYSQENIEHAKQLHKTEVDKLDVEIESIELKVGKCEKEDMRNSLLQRLEECRKVRNYKIQALRNTMKLLNQ